ncbi:MAG: GNAT family N-acetyltransferase [Campylobacterota bacterium]|nr:GNAT family N-acetyltransferase [Campylobacterota bacterium]
MQIRELDLKELDRTYSVAKQLNLGLTYQIFEDLIYDMRHMEYKMFGIMDGEKLITYAGVAIQTTLKNRRHLKVFDFVTDKNYDSQKYDKIMKDYLNDYAKVGMCERVIYEEELKL